MNEYQAWLLELGDRVAMYLALSVSGRQYLGVDGNRTIWEDYL